MNHPKISIITPVYNQVDYIEQTILSVVEQDYTNFEYIIVDGGSTDGTLDVIKTFDDKITIWISEPDFGMYDALSKGFRLSTGEIMCWINSDDILLKDALVNMARLFNDLPSVNWIQGVNSFIDLKGRIIDISIAKKFSLLKFIDSDYKWIQQESTFWRRCLWESAGGYIDDSLKYAGDFELWFRFFQHEKLYNANLSIGAWRKRENQLSNNHQNDYLSEVTKVLKEYKIKKEEKIKLRRIRLLNFIIRSLIKTKCIKVSYFINKRTELYEVNKNYITYSYDLNKFTTPS